MTLQSYISRPRANWIACKTEYNDYNIYELYAGQALRPEVEEWLIDGLTRAMPELKIAASFDIRRSTFSSSTNLTVAVDKATLNLIAFLNSRMYFEDAIGDPFLHASICLISDQYRRTLVFKHLWRLHLEQVINGPWGFPWVVALKTYNPAVYNALSVFASFDGVTLYPRIDGVGQDKSMIPLVSSIQAQIAAGLQFEWETGVIRQAGVPRDFFPKLPDHRRRDIYDYFRRNLRPGDRLLCVLKFPPRSILQSRVLKMFGVRRGEQGECERQSG